MKTVNPVPFIVAALIVAGGAYYYFFINTGNDAPLAADVQESSAQTKFKVLVSELAGISFNTKIFEDPRFKALQDLSTPVQDEVSGRVDPFAPIAGVTDK
jgi:hypothetical protein